MKGWADFMASVRLDKLLADMGIASRKELKEMIRAGRVTVDGAVITAPETKVDGEHNSVALDGDVLKYARFHYYMLYKPCGVVTATEDKRQGTVLDLLPPELRRMGLFPVGRLDKDTSGLLLLTDDGEYAHRVISPKSEIVKLYYAMVDGRLDKADIAAFEKGLILADGTHCLPAKLELLSENECTVAVMEGKYHQVRRMLASRSATVTKLKRLSIGALKLDENMREGDFRELDQSEANMVYIEK